MFSFVFPMDSERLPQFKVTKELYDEMPQVKEFVIPTREIDRVQAFLEENKLMKDVRLIPYEVAVGFNPSKAFNIGYEKLSTTRLLLLAQRSSHQPTY